MLSDSPPERDLEWSEAGIEGASRFVQRVWRLANGDSDAAAKTRCSNASCTGPSPRSARRSTALQFNKAVAQLYELVSAIEKAKPSATRAEAVRTLILLIAPMAPHLAEECWALLGAEGMSPMPHGRRSIRPCWSTTQVTLAVQVNGKLRDTLTAPRGLDRAAAEALALASDKVQRQLDGASPRKVIVVPDRLVNIVA